MDEILEYIDTIDAVRLLAKFGETFKFISDVFVAEKKIIIALLFFGSGNVSKVIYHFDAP